MARERRGRRSRDAGLRARRCACREDEQREGRENGRAARRVTMHIYVIPHVKVFVSCVSHEQNCVKAAMEFPAALPWVEAGMMRPGIARHLAAVTSWVTQGEGIPESPPVRSLRASFN